MRKLTRTQTLIADLFFITVIFVASYLMFKAIEIDFLVIEACFVLFGIQIFSVLSIAFLEYRYCLHSKKS